MKTVNELKVKLFADGANLEGMLEMYKDPMIKGFTTNPTLMRKAGIADYGAFAREVVSQIPDRPLSFEVFSDDFTVMLYQAKKIASWGKNVYVKIPVTNTKGESTDNLVKHMVGEGIKVNVTAITTLEQVKLAASALSGSVSSYVSLFAGRVADTGRDPVPVMKAAVDEVSQYSGVELIWASPRELLNVFQADDVGCHIITATNDILKKLLLVGKDLTQYSLETVQMFYNDAQKVGYTI